MVMLAHLILSHGCHKISATKFHYFLYFPGYELFSSHLSFGPVMDRQKVMHVSPPCTVVLKKYRPSRFPSEWEAQVGSENWNEQEWPLHFGCL